MTNGDWTYCRSVASSWQHIVGLAFLNRAALSFKSSSSLALLLSWEWLSWKYCTCLWSKGHTLPSFRIYISQKTMFQAEVKYIVVEAILLNAVSVIVLLCPYGLRGTLTGHSSNEDNINANDMLEKWRKFYPTELGMDWTFSANQAEEQDAPLLVQVLFGEVQMWYPSVHVMRQCQELGSIVSSLCHKGVCSVCNKRWS